MVTACDQPLQNEKKIYLRVECSSRTGETADLIVLEMVVCNIVDNQLDDIWYATESGECCDNLCTY